jgi:hydroxyethylthiazole kinase
MSQALPAIIVATHLERLRRTSPLTHVITNDVVTGFTANVLLALGAAPAMITAPEEAGAFAALASALSVNVGTLTSTQAATIRIAVQAANQANTPWVLDPVAAGVLPYRTELCRELLNLRPTAIRGNASEIMALAGHTTAGKGVDSADQSDQAIGAAQILANACGAIVAVTGEIDYITDGARVVHVKAGDPLMTRVTGTGCALSSVVAAFVAGCEEKDRLDAVASACAVMAIAGQRAAAQAKGPGSFVPLFLDKLYQLDAVTLAEALA